jgi:hypothetical protein
VAARSTRRPPPSSRLPEQVHDPDRQQPGA